MKKEILISTCKWLFLSCFTEKFWHNLCIAIERPDLERDERFGTNTDRVKNRDGLVPMLQEIFGSKPMAAWIEKLKSSDVPCGPVNDLNMALSDQQVKHNRMVVELEHKTIGTVKSLANPIHFSGTPVSYRLPPPALGQHTIIILQQLGFTRDEIKRMQENKIICSG